MREVTPIVAFDVAEPRRQKLGELVRGMRKPHKIGVEYAAAVSMYSNTSIFPI